MKNRKATAKRNLAKTTRKVDSDKFYSTVWLSDYESWDMKSETGEPSTGVSSHATTPYSSRPTTPIESKGSSPLSSPPPSPFVPRETFNVDEVFSSVEISQAHDLTTKPTAVKLKRTLSLPESELSQIEANDLQQRFTTLQLEQENRELKQITDDLQDALENLEKRVHCVAEQHDEGEINNDRSSLHSNDDIYTNDQVLPRHAGSEPSTPSSLSSNDTFLHCPKLSKPSTLNLRGNNTRKRKHNGKQNTLNGKTEKTKEKDDSLCCITS